MYYCFFFLLVQKESTIVQYERSESDLRNLKLCREEESRKYSHEFERLNSEIALLKTSETNLLKSINQLKEENSNITIERDEMREQNDNYQSELENIQKMLYDETESSSKSATKVILLTRQLDEEQRRATDATQQLDDLRMQLKGSTMVNDTLKTELSQARSIIQEHVMKVYNDFHF